MALAVWQRTIVDEAGNVIPGASVEVRSEATGNLAILKSVRSGATGMLNPATADSDGFVQFFTAGGSYRVVASSGAFSREWRYVGIGTAQEVDVEDIHGFSGLNYLRSTSTASDASPGTVRGNSADLSGATALYFASLDNHTNDQSNRIVHYGDSSSEIRGSITLHQLAGGGEITFNVTGLSVDLREASPQLDVIEVPVAYTSGIDVFANGDSVSVEFSRTGDKGLATGVPDGDKVDLAVLGDTWTINPGVVTYDKMQDVSATARLLGRITAGAGDPEELTGTQATTLLDAFTTTLKGLTPLSGGGTVNFLRADGSWSVPPVTDGDKGDVTVTASGATWTIDNDVVTYAKMQNVSATARLLGRITSGAGDAEELTGTQATSLLNVFTSTLNGLVPLSGGGITFLRADGTWAVPAGGGNVSGPVSATDNAAARFDLTTGTLLQDSTVIISDTGAVTGVAALTTSGVVTVGTTASTAPVIDPSGFGQMPEIAAPATPATGHVRLYAKADGHLYQKDDVGLETDLATSAGSPSSPQGRLTLVTATPVMVATQTAKTTIYYTPYVGRHAPIYDGAAFVMRDLGGELSLALNSNAAHTGYHQSGKNFDLFLSWNAGSPRLVSGPAWTSNTARADAIARLNGYLVNSASIVVRFGTASGDTATVAASLLTYVGTFRASANGQTEFVYGTVAVGGGAGSHLLWNAYNRRVATSIVRDSTDSWSWTTAGWRAYNNSAGNKVGFVSGTDDDEFDAIALGTSTAGAGFNAVGIGYDSTSIYSGTAGYIQPNATNNATGKFSGAVIGYHEVSIIEYGGPTASFFGDAGVSGAFQTGLHFRMPM